MTTASGPLDPTTYPAQAPSVPWMLQQRVTASPRAEAFRFPRNDGWTSVTWAQVWETVKVTAAGLLSLGIRPGDRIAIASNTRIEWIYADLAVMCAAAATTAVYPTTGAEDVTFILRDSATRIAFAEDEVQIAKLRSQRDHLPDLVRVIAFDGEADGEWVLSLADLQARGAKLLVESPNAVDQTVAAISPDQLATLIYTSGTTGRPKGVELPHRSWTYLGAAAEALEIVYPSDLQYLWLPLSHAFGRMLVAVQLQVGFASAVDGRVDKIVDNVQVVRPTFMAGPPRIFEKVHAKVVQSVEEQGGVKARLYGWAIGVGTQVSRARLQDQRPSARLRAQHAVADRLVLRRIRAGLGGRIRFLVSGSASLAPDITAWFAAVGLTVIEGYGLTETGGGACIGSIAHPAFGTVGSALQGSQIRLADDGEILIRGPMMMLGYHNLPEATAQVLTPDGWLLTGDVGELDPAGRLRVTDRKKDLIKTSGGKYIAPQVIEVMFKALCPLASHILVHGEGRNYATALITLDPDALTQWSRAQSLTGSDYRSLAADPAVETYVRTCVTELNNRLNRWETIKDFRIVDHDLTIEDDELTPSTKMKRNVIEARFRNLLDSMYKGHSGD